MGDRMAGGVRRLAFVAMPVVLALALSSCAYYQGAVNARDAGGSVPWWCTSTEEIPVTQGPAVGTVDWYADIDKAPLAWDDCVAMSVQFDAAKKYAVQFPTRGQAEADGFREITSFIPGMGTHHVKGGITPQMLADPSFDTALNPILDNRGSTTSSTPQSPRSCSTTATAQTRGWWASTTTCARPRAARPRASPATSTGGITTRGSATARPTRR